MQEIRMATLMGTSNGVVELAQPNIMNLLPFELRVLLGHVPILKLGMDMLQSFPCVVDSVALLYMMHRTPHKFWKVRVQRNGEMTPVSQPNLLIDIWECNSSRWSADGSSGVCVWIIPRGPDRRLPDDSCIVIAFRI
ncbi:hypothetical protein HAX54_028179 [Datura stramonium]|uniref:Uncharacterized protein n=1 Tax=Datura stramonium TaxID=4076 RepID=A0ABS8S9C5_DATST|nr:hypothetical protein [Datura stramonium]